MNPQQCRWLARERLVRAHLPLVHQLASRYRDYGLPFDDLVQEGCLGLLEAVENYEPARGASFESYARFRVRRAIRNALTDKARLVRLPKQIVERRRALDRVETRLVAAGTQPSPADLAAATGLPIASVLEARAAARVPLSLDEPLLPDGSPRESLVADPAASDPVVETLAREQSALLQAALATLPPRKRHVVTAQWGLNGQREVNGVALARELELSPRCTQTLGQEALLSLAEELGPALH